MEERESIIIDIQIDAKKVADTLGSATNALRTLKQEQKSLDKQLQDGTISLEEYGAAIAKNKAAQEQANRTIKTATAQLQAYDIQQVNLNGTLDEQRQALNTLQKAYGSLSDEQKNAAVDGKTLTERIGELSDKVKEQEGSIGDYRRNVGNYPKAWDAVSGKVSDTLGKIGVSMEDLQTKGVKAFANIGTSLKSFGKMLITPPIAVVVAIISAILFVVQKLTEAFKKNDAAMTALQKAMAALEPITDIIGKLFDGLATALVKVFDGVSKVVGVIASKLSPAYAEAAEKAQELVQAQDDLEEAERQYTVNSAERNKEIARLRAEASDKEHYTAAERKKMMEQAIELQRQNLEDEKNIAAEKLRILEETAKKESDTSDETMNKIAQARAAMLDAETAYYSGVKSLQQQMTSFEKEIQDERKRRADEAKKTAEERAKNDMEIAQMAEDFALSLIADETEKAIATRKIQGEREIKQLQQRLNTEKNLTETARAQLAALITAKQAALDAELTNMADEAVKKKTDEEYAAEQAKAQRILEYKKELAAEGSAEELELQKQLLDLQMQQALDETTLEEEEKQLIRETFAQKRAELDKQYNDNLVKQATDAREQYRKSLLDTAKNASNTFGAMQSLLEEYGEENEQAAAASKAFGVAKIITDQAISIADTAKAITSAVAGATDAAAAGGPAAPFLLAGYIAAMVGAVLGAVAGVAGSIQQAKQLMSGGETNGGKFATGGFVPGTSYVGDNVNIRANSGEAVLTPSQQQHFMELANGAGGGFDYGALADVIIAGVAAQPAPVMVYQEFEDFQQKTATYNEIAKV